MIVALVSLVLQVFLVVYLSFVVAESLTFSTGDCAVRSLEWHRFWDRIPGVSPKFVEAEMGKVQHDPRGNKYTHHLWLKLEFLGLDIPFESAVGLPLNPRWTFWGLTGNRDLDDPVEVSRFEVVNELNKYQKEKL